MNIKLELGNFSGGQMRLPALGGQGALPFPPRGYPVTPMDIETSIQNWRENFINKYQDNKEVGFYFFCFVFVYSFDYHLLLYHFNY